ncbi:hypothetical protein [Flavobacterium sp. WC2430]|uniref:hypothetical protein n=1 Tax=Flavobacterium sp. WC2430 TaxID=3234137 RepID=UPI0034664CEF
MEALWIFPLYFVCPIVGIILLIFGIFQYYKRKDKSRIITGIFFISLPIIHLFLMEVIQNNFEKNVVGHYNILEKNEIVLKIKNDGTFELNNLPGLKQQGKGKWDIFRGDITTLDLHFKNNQEADVSFEINDEKKHLKLTSSPFENYPFELIKK